MNLLAGERPYSFVQSEEPGKIMAERLHIVMLLENNAYPQDARVRMEAMALTGEGHEVTVIAPNSKKHMQPWHEMVDGVRVYRFHEPPEASGFVGYLLEYGYSLIAMFFLSLLVFLRHGFDVIHAHNPPDILSLVAAFYKPFGKVFVFDHHDLSPEMYNARLGGQGSRTVYRALVFFERLTYRLANRIIVTNQSYKTIAMTRGSVDEERITIVRNGPDQHHMQPSAPHPALESNDKTLLGYAGLMGPQDGIDYLIRALKHVVEDLNRTDFLCIMLGDGECMPELKQLVADYELESYVHFAGWISDVNEFVQYLNSVDICLAPEPSNPYTDRSTTIKMMEYMAAGKPIVAFDLPEHRFTAEDAAVYATPNDELEFAQLIARLIDSPDERTRRGEFGRNRVVSELAWPYQEKKLLAAYRSLAQEVSKRRFAL